jgi:ParB family chromosome partitioning protein
MSRKDSRGMFANVLGNLDQAQTPNNAPTRSASPHLMKVAAGVREFHEKGEALAQLLKDGDNIIELSPDEISPSPILDRFDGAYDGEAVKELAESMKERGQIVPGLVRPITGGEKPYEIVFGRRRLAAARLLGLKFRAILRKLTDEEAIVFQGEENTNRNDLSFIEKCAFAFSQEEAGYRRETICASLSTGKSHISEMLRLASSIQRDVLMLIGAAPEIGRRRWVAFQEVYAAHGNAADCVKSALLVHRETDTNQRFQIALSALTATDKKQLPNSREAAEIKASGFLLATVSYQNSGTKMTFTKSVAPEFIEFLKTRMESLHSEFVQSINVET